MIFFLIFTSIGISTLVVYKNRRVRETIRKKYEKAKELREFIREQNKYTSSSDWRTELSVLYQSAKLLCRVAWVSLLQKLNNSIEYIPDHKNQGKVVPILSYVYNGNLYKTKIRQKRGPETILLAMGGNSEENSPSNNEEDITKLMNEFIGANRDWHRQEYTPEFFGYDSIFIEYSSGESKNFSKHEILQTL